MQWQANMYDGCVLNFCVANFSLKDQMENILGSAGHKVSVSFTNFYPCSVKTAAE